MGSLEQKQTVEWTLLRAGVKRWSFFREMFYREEAAPCSSARSDGEVWKGNADMAFGEFSSTAFLYCDGVTESQQTERQAIKIGKTDLADKKAQVLLARPVGVCM